MVEPESSAEHEVLNSTTLARPLELDTLDTLDAPVRGTVVLLSGSADPAPAKYPLSETNPTLIGRSGECQIRLGGNGVSRTHAKIELSVAEGGFVVSDLDSRNGTFVNGRRIKSARLNSGDYILVGTHAVLLFTRSDPLEEQIEQARRMEALGQLAAGVAHDFNNVLGVVMASLGYVGEYLKKTRASDSDVLESLADAEESVRRGAELARQVLRVTAGQDRSVGPVDVGLAASDLARLLVRAVGPKVRISVRCTPGARVQATRSEIDQIILNVAKNACDAMAHGGELLIVVEAVGPDDSESAEVTLTFTDTGPGIAPENLERIFDPFFTTKSAKGGTGLGLATVRSIVGKLGGDVSVRSVVGQGSEFVVRLPREPNRPSSSPAETRRQRTTLEIGGLVLVVDRDPSFRRAARRLLETLGYKTAEASGMSSLIEVAEQKYSDIRWVMIDPQLEDATPELVLTTLQRVGPQGVRVLLALGGELETVRAEGVVGCLRKPFDREDLKRAIEGFDSEYLAMNKVLARHRSQSTD
ncbi:MAG: FHA domain-containing protein [Deltaproteobacteria bacterium]|nr:FHA domain-containing protein [Deltaproteobacteria bacterium]